MWQKFKRSGGKHIKRDDENNIYTPEKSEWLNKGQLKEALKDQKSGTKVNSMLFSMLIGLAMIFVLSTILRQLELRVTGYVKLHNAFRPTASADMGQHTYRAELVAQTYRAISIESGKGITFEAHFKNIGNRPWFRDGASPLELTVSPTSRESVFYHKFWVGKTVPAKLLQSQVNPGEVGIFRFAMEAPNKGGEYSESFALVAKNLAWVEGGRLNLPITVKEATPVMVKKVEPKIESNVAAKTAVAPVVTAKTEVVVVPAVKNVNVPAEGVSYAAKPLSNQAWSAQLFLRSHREVSVPAGEQVVVRLGFRNLGTKTWKNDGAGFISLYTHSPAYRKSVFAGDDWYSAGQIKMETAEVGPGAIGFIVITLNAPEKPGRYTEQFRLAAEDTAWVNGGTTDLPITVTEKINKPIEQVAVIPEATPTVTSDIKPAVKTEAVSLPAISEAVTVAPKQPDTEVRATKVITLTSTNLWGEVITTTVTMDRNKAVGNNDAVLASDKPVDPPVVQPTVESTTPAVVGNIRMSEPLLRVGLYKATEPVKLKANQQFQVRDGLGAIIGAVGANEIITVIYDFNQKIYFANISGREHQVTGWIRFEPVNSNTIFEIVSHEDHPAWNPSLNDNEFRGTLEMRFSETDGTLWMINELPMEDYLKGIAETSNPNPIEYLKTMTVAARTYALYHFDMNTKHVNRNFHVDARYDQVYKGYGQEKRSPRLVRAVEETRGRIVTYNNEIAVTPYFSRSDGRTRDWIEVWGGSGYPWLKSVITPHDVGRTLWGHGVGIAATDALGRAADGETYDQMLGYYYTGTGLEQFYQ